MQDKELSTQELIAQEVGARLPEGLMARVIGGIALLWSLFQLWIASPLPFVFGVGVFNDTETRSIHLAFALLLAFLAYPAFKRSPRAYVPATDIALALVAAASAVYLFIFYQQLAQRPGSLTTLDLVAACVGIPLLLEATRRALGPPLAIIALVFLFYSLAGPWMPGLLEHRGVSFTALANHQWITTEGVFGIALGVSTSFVFLFVLFGALLERAGAGHYFIQLAFSLLGHMRGGPAKAAVVSSALTGMISGSSIANVVTTGTFTIPMMKKVGFPSEKAGAVEVASSVNGQIMPPVMGAAAFLMVEYVGIPYADIVKHAFLPAIISYIALFYIVHLEALRLGMTPSATRRPRPLRDRLIAWGMGLSGTIVVCALVYWVALGVQRLFGDHALWIIGALLLVTHVTLLWDAARNPDLPQDIDIENPVLPDTWPTVRAGLHFLIPIGVLIWCLMIEQLSPALSAFWATVTLLALMATQRPIIAFFRGQATLPEWRTGFLEVVQGLNDGARNMIGIGIATATAGIIVGGITLTGLGFRMTDFVEVVSQGNVVAMLLFTAFVCLVLGLGVPTTANYILVASLMAPVVVELGAQSGIVIPLIAVHLFVFYYGIMGDITPPVGLATFAAAAISGEDPIKTGIQGSLYALRTVVLPFVFIFNPALLLIDVRGWFELTIVAAAAIAASLTFAAATLGWFRVRCRWWEVVALLVATFALFRPDWFMDKLVAPYQEVPAAQIFEVAQRLEPGERLALVISGTNIEGDEIRKTVAVQLREPGDARQRLQEAGLTVTALGDQVQIANVRFGSRARKSGFEIGWEIGGVLVPNERPSQYWFYIPALLLVGLVWWGQGRRMPSARPVARAA